jgi:hypothetical protein
MKGRQLSVIFQNVTTVRKLAQPLPPGPASAPGRAQGIGVVNHAVALKRKGLALAPPGRMGHRSARN